MVPRTPALLLTVIRLVTLGLFFWAPFVRNWGSVLPRPVQLMCGLSRSREGLIKKHGPSKEIESPFLFGPSPPSEARLGESSVGDVVVLGAWDFFIPSFQCPHHVERVGVLGDGGKWVCGMERIAKQEECVIYLFGCEVWEYDFSVDNFGPEVKNAPNMKECAHFFPWALGAHGPDDLPKYHTLDALRQNGHAFVDVLNIDVEGAECDRLTAHSLAAHNPLSPFSSTTLPIGQLQIELHAWDNHDWWAALEAAGLTPFCTESNLVYVNYNAGGKLRLAEYSLMNIRGNHSLVYVAADWSRRVHLSVLITFKTNWD
ncbi:hypothetical protein EDB84DRAFT_1440387 [Lactarius hengduanensis]|nr:hypothetical protein EDB84DRAFT_1440387 [Lactarius hengduanensis]